MVLLCLVVRYELVESVDQAPLAEQDQPIQALLAK